VEALPRTPENRKVVSNAYDYTLQLYMPREGSWLHEIKLMLEYVLLVQEQRKHPTARPEAEYYHPIRYVLKSLEPPFD
jgi:hypothetical protein